MTFPSEFGRWHRVASEAILKAARDENPDLLIDCVESAVAALRNANNDYEIALALGVIHTAVNMRLVAVKRGQSQGTEHKGWEDWGKDQ